MIEESDILLIIPAIAAVVISAIGILRSNKLTRKSNDLMEKDMSLRNRAWVTISEPKIVWIAVKNKRLFQRRTILKEVKKKGT